MVPRRLDLAQNVGLAVRQGEDPADRASRRLWPIARPPATTVRSVGQGFDRRVLTMKPAAPASGAPQVSRAPERRHVEHTHIRETERMRP